MVREQLELRMASPISGEVSLSGLLLALGLLSILLLNLRGLLLLGHLSAG